MADEDQVTQHRHRDMPRTRRVITGLLGGRNYVEFCVVEQLPSSAAKPTQLHTLLGCAIIGQDHE